MLPLSAYIIRFLRKNSRASFGFSTDEFTDECTSPSQDRESKASLHMREHSSRWNENCLLVQDRRNHSATRPLHEPTTPEEKVNRGRNSPCDTNFASPITERNPFPYHEEISEQSPNRESLAAREACLNFDFSSCTPALKSKRPRVETESVAKPYPSSTEVMLETSAAADEAEGDQIFAEGAKDLTATEPKTLWPSLVQYEESLDVGEEAAGAKTVIDACEDEWQGKGGNSSGEVMKKANWHFEVIKTEHSSNGKAKDEKSDPSSTRKVAKHRNRFYTGNRVEKRSRVVKTNPDISGVGGNYSEMQKNDRSTERDEIQTPVPQNTKQRVSRRKSQGRDSSEALPRTQKKRQKKVEGLPHRRQRRGFSVRPENVPR
ncbi:hypothetical protein R1flu_003319 [Riccia fluitans]|uniref:Uncharacterized protein n=1 Tax=Riccia fluitans TaxID=41844 RepID=A0ABD1Y8P1_9MARC